MVTICDHHCESRYFAFTSFAMSRCASFLASCWSNKRNHSCQDLPVALRTASSLTAGFSLAMRHRASELEHRHPGERVVHGRFLARQMRVDFKPGQLAFDAVLYFGN